MRLFLSKQEETPADVDEQIRKARLEVARGNQRWTEIEEGALVRRGPFLVDADTDEVFTVFRGVVFEPGSANLIADQAPYWFVVGRDGELRFLERQHGTWSERVEKRARREAQQRL